MKRLSAYFQYHRWAILIAAFYITIATAYNLSNPLFEAPDERLHLEFIRALQESYRLPVVDPQSIISHLFIMGWPRSSLPEYWMKASSPIHS